MESLESSGVRPRQARYQAALRPDTKCQTDSKASSNFTPNPRRYFLPHRAKTVPEYNRFRKHWTHIVEQRSV